jgi:hypothetical protein
MTPTQEPDSDWDWERLLYSADSNDDDERDISSIVSREFGPLHMPPSLDEYRRTFGPATDGRSVGSRQTIKSNYKGGKRKSRKHRLEEMNETLVTEYSYRDSRGLTKRIVILGLILGALIVASFATTNLILDTFKLRPDEVAVVASQDIPERQQVLTRFVATERFLIMRKRILAVSDTESFSDPQSPQTRALDWLANRDGLKLEVNAPNLIQRYTLAVLFYSTGGENWRRDLNWLSDEHECQWNAEGGIRSCTQDNEVKDISLWNNLKGSIPNELGVLTKLEILYLARNSLQGTIPTQLGLLTDLTYIGLHVNSLVGSVPSIFMGNLTKLKTIYLQKNYLTGTIRRVEPLCQLRKDAVPPKGSKFLNGSLEHVTADCKVMVKWKKPQVACGCCTQCYL